MGFIVKLTGTAGGPSSWLSAPTEMGIRTLTIRGKAGIFGSQEDARVAIERMPSAFVRSGFVFSVELVK